MKPQKLSNWSGLGEKPPFKCKYCGSPSWIDPSEQSLPPDYCHESDHGEPPSTAREDPATTEKKG